MDKGKMNDGAATARDPSMTTSGDPRRDNPLGGGTATGPRPDAAGDHAKVRTGDRNARSPFDDAPDRQAGGTGKGAP